MGRRRKLAILLAPIDVISTIRIENKSKEKSNRLCFVSEKLNLQGKPDDAIQALKEAITLDTTNSTALCLLGGMYNEKNSAECIQFYEKSIQINKKCYLAYRGLVTITSNSNNMTRPITIIHLQLKSIQADLAQFTRIAD